MTRSKDGTKSNINTSKDPASKDNRVNAGGKHQSARTTTARARTTNDKKRQPTVEQAQVVKENQDGRNQDTGETILDTGLIGSLSGPEGPRLRPSDDGNTEAPIHTDGRTDEEQADLAKYGKEVDGQEKEKAKAVVLGQPKCPVCKNAIGFEGRRGQLVQCLNCSKHVVPE